MTVLDWGIVAFTLALGLWGYRQGLIVGDADSALASRSGRLPGAGSGPWLLNQGSESPYAPLCAALGALIGGALVAVALESFALGLRARVIAGRGALHRADGAGGAALIAAVALGLVWVFGAVALHAPGTARLRADVQDSLILQQPQRSAAAVGRDPAGARPGRPGALDRRARRHRWRAPDPKVVADPDVMTRRRLGGSGARHRLRARDRGLGLGRPRRGSSSPTPTSSPARTTRR